MASQSAPLQNMRSCKACVSNPVLQFKSASEVAEYRKRRTTTQYYTDPSNVFPTKNRYGSMYTTYKKAQAVQVGADQTCCGKGLTPLSGGKDAPAFLFNKFNPT